MSAVSFMTRSSIYHKFCSGMAGMFIGSLIAWCVGIPTLGPVGHCILMLCVVFVLSAFHGIAEHRSLSAVADVEPQP